MGIILKTTVHRRTVCLSVRGDAFHEFRLLQNFHQRSCSMKLGSYTSFRPQVTGSILECMADVEDVREYVSDEAIKMIHILRFLKRLKEFQADQSQSKLELAVQ